MGPFLWNPLANFNKRKGKNVEAVVLPKGHPVHGEADRFNHVSIVQRRSEQEKHDRLATRLARGFSQADAVSVSVLDR